MQHDFWSKCKNKKVDDYSCMIQPWSRVPRCRRNIRSNADSWRGATHISRNINYMQRLLSLLLVSFSCSLSFPRCCWPYDRRCRCRCRRRWCPFTSQPLKFHKHKPLLLGVFTEWDSWFRWPYFLLVLWFSTSFLLFFHLRHGSLCVCRWDAFSREWNWKKMDPYFWKFEFLSKFGKKTILIFGGWDVVWVTKVKGGIFYFQKVQLSIFCYVFVLLSMF